MNDKQRKENEKKRIPPRKLTELSKVQMRVLRKRQHGSVIGEFSNKINGLYELFTRKPGSFKPTALNEHPFEIERLNKNTVFALLELGLIEQDDFVETMMSPFSRDCWYVHKDV